MMLESNKNLPTRRFEAVIELAKGSDREHAERFQKAPNPNRVTATYINHGD